MYKILVAYDGSECAENAIKDLRRAGLPGEAEALVVTVADPWIGSGGLMDNPVWSPHFALALADESVIYQECMEEARKTAEKGAQILGRYFPCWSVQSEAVSDTPAWGIIHRAQSWKPDLTVMGSHGRSGVGRAIFGSVSHQVMTHLCGNLRIARDSGELYGGAVRVLVAFDGSEESEYAFRTALSRNWPKQTEVKLVTVVDMVLSMSFICPSAPIRYWMRPDDTSAVDWVRRMQKDQVRRVEEKGWVCSSEMIHGEAREAILKEAKLWRADCLFVGSRGLGLKERFLLGSVSSGLAIEAHCSVEIAHEFPCSGSARQVHSSESQHTGPLKV